MEALNTQDISMEQALAVVATAIGAGAEAASVSGVLKGAPRMGSGVKSRREIAKCRASLRSTVILNAAMDRGI